MPVEKPRIRGRVSTLVAQVSADKVRAAARAATVVCQGSISDPACLNSHDSDVLLATRYLFPTSRPSLSLRSIPHFHIESTNLSRVASTLRSTSSGIYFLSPIEQPNVFSSVASSSSSSRACVRKSFNVCAQARVHMCTSRDRGPPMEERYPLALLLAWDTQ